MEVCPGHMDSDQTAPDRLAQPAPLSSRTESMNYVRLNASPSSDVEADEAEYYGGGEALQEVATPENLALTDEIRRISPETFLHPPRAALTTFTGGDRLASQPS